MSLHNLSENNSILALGIDSGTKSTTLSDLTNCSAPVAQEIDFIKIGSQVFCSFYVFLTSTISGPMQFSIDTLPVPKESLLLNNDDIHGTAVWQNGGLPLAGSLNVKAGKLHVLIQNTTGSHGDEVSAQFSYNVL